MFLFQVGGHSKLIKVGNGCIGKPLIPRELEMYRLSPPKLAPFIPEFKGKAFKIVTRYSSVPNGSAGPNKLAGGRIF